MESQFANMAEGYSLWFWRSTWHGYWHGGWLFLLIGLFCGAMALLTYAVSLYYHPNAVVVAILPSLATAVLYLILGALRKSEWIAIDLLQLRSENVNPSAFFVIGVTLLLPFLLSLWLLLMKLKNRDEL